MSFHAGSLDDGDIGCQAAAQYHQTTLVGVGELRGVYAAIFLVCVQGLPDVFGGKWLGGAHATWGCQVQVAGFFQFLAAADIPVVQPVVCVFVQRGVDIHLQMARAAQLAQDGGDTTGAVDVFNVPDTIGCNLGQARNSVGDFLDILQGEINSAFLCCRQGVQDGVGGSAHGHIQRHGDVERVLVGDIARQNRLVFFTVVAAAQLNNGRASLLKQTTTEGVGGQGRAVARQSQA